MRLFSENFDFWPIATPIIGAVTEDRAHTRDGPSCAACADAGFNIIEVHPAGVLGRKYFYRIAARLSKLPTATTAVMRLLHNESTILEVTVNEAGEVRMWNPVAAAHPAGEIVSKVAAEEWFVVEAMLVVNAEGKGKLSWRLNGVEKAAEQEMTVGNLGITKARFGNPGAITSGAITYLDDMAINDDQGAANNTWVGTEPDPVAPLKPRYVGADIAETEADPHPTEPAPYNEAIWNRFEADAGRPMGIIHYGDPWGNDGPIWDGYFTGAAERVDARGAIALKSLGGPENVIQRVLAREFDDAIRAWAKAARDFRRPFFLRLWWEQNGTWFPWGRQAATGAEYIAAWRRFHSLVSSTAPNVTFVWCPNAFLTEFPEYDPFEGPEGNTYPGDEFVDWVAVDGYTGENPHKKLGFRTPTGVFGHSYEVLQERVPTKPIIVCEVACSEYTINGGEPEPPKKAEWIRQLLVHAVPVEMPNIRAVCWFNWNIEEGGGRIDWPIESSPSAQASFKSSIADSHYIGPIAESIPDLIKVPLPDAIPPPPPASPEKSASVNHASDPGFESGTVSHEFREVESGVTDATRVVSNLVEPTDPDSGPVIDGNRSLRVRASANASTGAIISVAKPVPTLVGQLWSAGVWAGFTSAGMNARLSLGFQTAAGVDLGSPAFVDGVVQAVNPEFLSVEGQVAPVDATHAVVRLTLFALEAVPGSTTFDNLLLVKDEAVPEHPIDGDRGGMQWQGARFFSPSLELEADALVAEWESWTPPYLWAPRVLSKDLAG